MKKIILLSFFICMQFLQAEDTFRDALKKEFAKELKPTWSSKRAGDKFTEYIKSAGNAKPKLSKIRNELQQKAVSFITGGGLSLVTGVTKDLPTSKNPFVENLIGTCYEPSDTKKATFDYAWDACGLFDDFSACSNLPDMGFLGWKKRSNPKDDIFSLKRLCQKAQENTKDTKFGFLLAENVCFPKDSEKCRRINEQLKKERARKLKDAQLLGLKKKQIKEEEIMSNSSSSSTKTSEKEKSSGAMEIDYELKANINVTANTPLDQEDLAKSQRVITDAIASNDGKTLSAILLANKILIKAGLTPDEDTNYSKLSVPFSDLESYENSLIEEVYGSKNSIGEMEQELSLDPYVVATSLKTELQSKVIGTDTMGADAFISNKVKSYRKRLAFLVSENVQNRYLLEIDVSSKDYVALPTKKTLEGVTGAKQKLNKFYDIQRQSRQKIKIMKEEQREANKKIAKLKILLESYAIEAMSMQAETAYLEAKEALEKKTKGLF